MRLLSILLQTKKIKIKIKEKKSFPINFLLDSENLIEVLLFFFFLVGKQVLIKFTQPEKEKKKRISSLQLVDDLFSICPSHDSHHFLGNVLKKNKTRNLRL